MNLATLSWSLAKGWYLDQPLLVRFREFPRTFHKDQYPVRLNIFWTMAECAENGLPSDGEAKRLETFEDRLVDAVEGGEHAILSVVLTYGGKREFVFHTRDAADFVSRLSSMPQESDRYPVEIQSHADPRWEYDDSVTRDFVSGPLQ